MSSYPPQLKTGGVILSANTVAASVNSDILNIERAKHIGIDLFMDNVTDGTYDFVGNVEVEVCNDLTVATPNWVPIELSTGSTKVAITAATNINDFYDLTDVAAKYMQVSIVRTSGTCTSIRAVAHCKAV